MSVDIVGAIEEEKRYLADRQQGINTSLLNRLVRFGYSMLDNYFTDKKQYLFSQWSPEIYYYDVLEAPQKMEEAILNKKYGIYFLSASSTYAFYGSAGIDMEICERLNVIPTNMSYDGGIIIGDAEDLAIEILIPSEIGICRYDMLQKFSDILNQYIGGVAIDGNDILVNDKKVLGCMDRHVGDVYVWAAQISFTDHTEYICNLSNKAIVKQPGYISDPGLNKEILKEEIVRWLQEP